MLVRLFALETFGIKLGLDNISQLCAALGHPERSFASLHVAGTNGKGSVTAMAHAAVDCADALIARGDLPVHPTFFEATTAMAFELFRRAGVEVAVIEVGLGGRFDSTNVITPGAGAIPSIGFDHQRHLGDTLEAIAFEKAGIIKPGMDVVIGALPEEARAVTARVAAEQAARLIDADADARVTGNQVDGGP